MDFGFEGGADDGRLNHEYSKEVEILGPKIPKKWERVEL